ncbi:MAG: STM3941 family protein [Pseudomonas sp.]
MLVMARSVTFRAGKLKALLLLVVSILFVVAGFWMINEESVIGWLCVIFFGLGIPVALLMLLPNAIFLRIDEAGFEMGSLFKSKKIRWEDVDGFRLESVRGAKIILIVFTDTYAQAVKGLVSRALLAGSEGAIADGFDASLGEVLDTLILWKSRSDQLPGRHA